MCHFVELLNVRDMLNFAQEDLKRFRELIADAKRVVLVSHVNADGDAVGSVLGSLAVIGGVNREAKITAMLPNGCPKLFGFLPGAGEIVSGDENLWRCEEAMGEADLIVGLDFNSLGRIDQLGKLLKESKGRKVLVDHHHCPEVGEFDVCFSVPELSSTCELAVWLYTKMFGDEVLNLDAGRCLLTGMCTDTGFFAYSCSRPSLFVAASKIVALGIDPTEIHNQIVNSFSVARMKFYGFAINERLRIFREKRVAYFYFSLEDQKRCGVGAEDMEGLVNYTLMMREIEVGALIREEENRTKISLRAKGSFDVNVFARKHWCGGGHTKAAGATSEASFEETVKMVEEKLLEEVRC